MKTPIDAPVASTSTSQIISQSTLASWEVVLRSPRRVVLHNASNSAFVVSDSNDWISDHASHEGEAADGQVREEDEDLEVIQSDDPPPPSTGNSTPQFCPLCLQPTRRRQQRSRSRPPIRKTSKNTSYFALLSEANSRANSPRPTRTNNNKEEDDGAGVPLDEATYNSGYFSSFFVDIKQLGKGGSGTVRLVRHVLNGEELGLYAVKTIAIGTSSARLPELLHEIHLLESLQHRNLVTYHHSWVETCRLSPYGPPVPALYVLMSWANGGSLHSFISRRRGEPDPDPVLSREERVRRFKTRNLGAIHLLRLDEILSIFEDCCHGLAFLHNRNILHLDLKADNVLLHWDEDALLPCAKLSDLGSSTSTGEASRRNRTGGSGTLDWCSPESWERDAKSGKLKSLDRATDLWALGLILHFLSFFTLPYRSDDPVVLEEEIKSYPGFLLTDAHALDHGNHIPPSLLRIISRLVHRNPLRRPSSEEVISLIHAVRAEEWESSSTLAPEGSALVYQQRTPSPPRKDAFIPKQLSMPQINDNPTTSTLEVVPPLKLSKTHSSRVILIRSSIAMISVLKAISLQHRCPGGSLSSVGQYVVLIPALIDLVLSDFRLSFLLGLLHITVMLIVQKQGLCAVSSSLLQYEP